MKLVFKLVAIAIFFLLVIGAIIGASIWEGVVAVAPDGVLPDTGYYAATNSFPRNTTVIVTNLENGKTIHVVVSAVLDNASILILLSKEAADAIALSANYPGRVRVMEAIDPVTMLPPLENKISNGDPDYDPMARINSAQQNSPAPLPESERPIALAEGAAPADVEGIAEGAAEDDGLSSPPLPENEPSALAEGSAAIDIEPADAERIAEGTAGDDELPPPLPESERPVALAEEFALLDTERIAEGAATEDELSSPFPENEPSALAEESVAADAGKIAEGAAGDDELSSLLPESERPVALVGESAPADITPDAEASVIYSDDYSLALVPAEKRAPEGKGVDIPLDEQVAPIVTQREQDRIPNPVSFITSIEDALAPAASQPQDVAVAPMSTNFSVPMTTSMEKGMYYVQLRSYSRPELLESELVKIGKQYNLSIQVTELSGKQLYRILIGPVSYSESNQLLQQYKAKGWSDAFVWLGK
ncbi:MAG: SPOR domain-containing protein [Treponema sp.]|jgi:hypothetical protein|nr:SPOR domain-containing protein [Treponema sp.]